MENPKFGPRVAVPGSHFRRRFCPDTVRLLSYQLYYRQGLAQRDNRSLSFPPDLAEAIGALPAHRAPGSARGSPRRLLTRCDWTLNSVDWRSGRPPGRSTTRPRGCSRRRLASRRSQSCGFTIELGVHWATDVVASTLFAGRWLVSLGACPPLCPSCRRTGHIGCGIPPRSYTGPGRERKEAPKPFWFELDT